MSKIIGVINYGSGNYKSLCNALDFLNINRIEVNSADDLLKSENIILPGVGTYGNCMERLNYIGLIEPIKKEVLDRKKNFLGICVGMQVLTDFGTEHGNHNGLGFVAGSTNIMSKSKDMSIPHIGWSSVNIVKNTPLFDSIENNSDFYFVHSYCVNVENNSLVSSFVQHGNNIPSSIRCENIYGVQFHPEKSQRNGLKLLKNFSKI